MTLTVGRASDLRVGPGGVPHSGRALLLPFSYQGTVAADVQARRQQLLGLLEPDEEVVPVIYTPDPTINGYYRVMRVDLERAKPLGALQLRGQLELEPVDSYANAQFEAVATMAAIVNSHGLPTVLTSGRIWLPGTDLRESSPPAGFNGNNFTSASARVDTAQGATAVAWPATQQLAGTKRWYWYTPPDHFFDASASIAVAASGTAYYPMVGRNAISINQESPPYAWRLSTGVTLLSWVQTSPSVLTLSFTDGSAVSQAWQIGGSTIGTLNTIKSFRIIRNRPESVTIRLTMASSVASTGTLYTVDITAKRGARFFDIVLNTGGNTEQFYVERTTVVASTAVTGGFRSTSTSGGTNAYHVAGGAAAQTNNLTNGRLQLTTAARQFHFMVSAVIAGSTGAATTAAQAEINDWSLGLSEHHRVVSR